MRTVMLIIALLLSLTIPSFAQNNSNSQNSLPSLIFDGKFKGPFRETVIVRIYDPTYGVVCYLYIPNNVSLKTSIDSSGIHTFLTSFAGNISCVKIK
ncbi:hypothetical protein [Phorcysia thermohydrogeniphila]|uniref:Uncharacterized protein n=1 Tax=Phorcysia thermohydrogeniphila TaxID=936138 RepID=A0A4R1GIC4_9BACT|nr:hypothetical protein [Phorcysia thermohydrogeniphila]TCK03992.1 hypothetical protein CLV27_1309 [Phorcysia thermohydrogeniphila]